MAFERFLMGQIIMNTLEHIKANYYIPISVDLFIRKWYNFMYVKICKGRADLGGALH